MDILIIDEGIRSESANKTVRGTRTVERILLEEQANPLCFMFRAAEEKWGSVLKSCKKYTHVSGDERLLRILSHRVIRIQREKNKIIRME